MSEPEPTTIVSSPPPSMIVRIISDEIHAVEALAATCVDCLNHAMLHSSYSNAINLACTLHSSDNLTDWFTVLVTENQDLKLKCDATIADHNALTIQVMQLKAQLTPTLALATAATNSSPTSHKGQTDPERFTGEDCGKLRSLLALLHSQIIDWPSEFLNEQSKLLYTFS